jgi:hypothetical protein
MTRLEIAALFAVGVGISGTADAGGGNMHVLGGDFSINGLVRIETAINTSDKASEFNQTADRSNGVEIRREAGNPLLNYTVPLTPSGLNDLTNALGLNVAPVTGSPPGVTNSIGTADTIVRAVPSKDPDINYHVLRVEVSPNISWGQFSIQSRFRLLYDPGSLGYSSFNMHDFDGEDGGIAGGVASEYHGKPNFLGYRTDDERNPLLFERSGSHYMIDAPALFAQWTNGNVTARLGNQTIAWGQLLFFRIMDQANGLDLRRHLFLDRALEEYADERMSAPGLRVTWQATDTIVADFFAQQFIPTIVPNDNTPYNVIASQFTLHDRYTSGGYDKKFNFGTRLRAEYGNFNLQAMYVNKLDQLGTITFTKSGVNTPLPNNNVLGAAFNQYCNSIAVANGFPSGQGCGPFLADTPFEVASAGVQSADQWFWAAGHQKLDGFGALNGLVQDFSTLRLLLAQQVNTVDAAANELDAFFIAGNSLHGHIQREYHREQVFGLGAGYVTEAEPGSIFDQAIINVETAYTRNRRFATPDVRANPPAIDDLQVGLVAEKYQRFSDSFPATYLVFQYLWQKESDLAGLRIDGYGVQDYSRTNNPIVLDSRIPTSTNPRSFTNRGGGVNHANYAVLAFLQPTDAYIWEYSAAMLIDTQGGILVQPAVQWKPQGNITVNLFYNYVNDDLWGNNPNKNVMALISHANELTIRLGYQF